MPVELLLKQPSVREAICYEKLASGRVRCGVCERRCVVPENQVGFCRTRMNIDGQFYTLVFGDISSMSANPIEKKPFFHFWPGSYALTVGTWSCNFTCRWCQNWEISKCAPNPLKANYVDPSSLVDTVSSERCQGTSVSFNEPTLLLEYSLEVFRLSGRRGFYNTYVSNGYMTLEALRSLRAAGMDAIKFDMKGNREIVKKYCAANVDAIWRNIGEAKRLGMHVEVVTLIIPGVNDSEECLMEIAETHAKEAGVDTPLHFTKFYPAYEMNDNPETPLETLEKARQMAENVGIQYAYLGNVPGHRWENTYCHICSHTLIQRYGFRVVKYALNEDGRCPKCREHIPMIVGHSSILHSA